MAAAPSSPPSAITGDTNVSTIDFLSLCHRLKTAKRSGWVGRNVRNPESIADHMYRMSLMALIAPDVPGLDRNKCIKMTILHDIAEAMFIGDISQLDGMSKAEKSGREQAALEYMCNMLGVEEGSRGKEISELWMEYGANSSPEAIFVKDLDKVEMILQALDYEDEAPEYEAIDLGEFFQSAAGKFQTEIGKAWASEIVSRRKKA
ncbi:hypothetical protein P8452_77908 [Trifolium repens]|nr:hypothetical protein P8452_77908 [Trifolium repens]